MPEHDDTLIWFDASAPGYEYLLVTYFTPEGPYPNRSIFSPLAEMETKDPELHAEFQEMRTKLTNYMKARAAEQDGG